MIYTIGFLAMLAARVVYAGMKQKELFYAVATDYQIRYKDAKKGELFLDGDKIFKYAAISVALVFLWPIALPALGLFKLGQRFGA